MAVVDVRPVALAYRALGLGDLLTAVPALRGIDAALPEHRLVLATTAGVAPLASLVPGVADVWTVGELAPLVDLAATPDVAVNLHGRGPQSTRLLHALGPRKLVAFGDPEAGVAGPPWRADEHEVARWCRLVDSGLDARCDPSALDLAVPPVDSPAPDAVVVHPGAAFGARRWPAERFGAVARALSADGHRVVVTGSPAEAVLARTVADAAGLPPDAVLAGRTDVVSLAALVAGARLVVCGDTGVAHLATAYRRPSVLLFGPTSPATWGPPPRPQHVVLFAGDGSGNPWGDVADPALLRLTTDDVLAATDVALRADTDVPADACRRTSAG